jgi:hypothetical protein
MITNVPCGDSVLAAQPDEDLEIERQCYDVRHIMRLRDQGKPYQTHLTDRGLLKAPPNEFCPATKTMRAYLACMKRDVERELEARLKTMPLAQALDHEEVFWWWGIDGDGLFGMAIDWFAHVHRFDDSGEPFVTPASWLLKWRPPVPFDFRKSTLSSMSGLIKHLVDEKDWPPLQAASKLPDRKQAA